MNRTIAGWMASALFAVSLPGLAAPPDTRGKGSGYTRLSYTYGEVRLVIQEPDRGDSFDGVRLGGALQFHPQMFANASLTTVSDGGADLDTLDLGLGFRHALRSDVDLVGIVGLVWADFDAGPFGDDDTGISLTGGVRTVTTPKLELGGYVNYTELFGDGDISLIGEGLLHLTPNVSLVGSLGLSDDFNVLTFGARWNFVASRRTAPQRTLQKKP